MKDNLVPEVRKDRNGKLVTRHVKKLPVVKSNKGIPAPSARNEKAEAERLTELTRRALIKLSRVGVHVISEIDAQHTVSHIVSHAPTLMNDMVDYLDMASPTEKEIWTYMFTHRASYPYDSTDKNDYLSDHRMNMELIPVAALMADNQHPEIHRIHFSLALVNHAWDQSVKEGKSKDVLWHKSFMLVNDIESAATGVSRKETDLEKVLSEVGFVMQEWDRIEPLIPVLVARKDASRAFIEDLWGNSSQTLNEGVL